MDSDFARLIRPDSGYAASVAVLVGDRAYPADDKHRETLCHFVVLDRQAGGGCSPIAAFFQHGPTSTGVSTSSGGDQYSWLSGLASDDVASIRLFLGNGETEDVPVTDNAYVAQVERAFFPVRVVAYDAEGRIVGNELPTGRRHADTCGASGAQQRAHPGRGSPGRTARLRLPSRRAGRWSALLDADRLDRRRVGRVLAVAAAGWAGDGRRAHLGG